MVAPKRVKLRRHCSTCGVQFDPPRTWAYCSKDCENGRRGRDPSESHGADHWLDPIYERRLRLSRQLESAMPWPTEVGGRLVPSRDEILEQIAATDREESAVREQLSAQSARRDTVEFWAPLVCREADRFETSLRKSLACAIRLGKRLCEAKAALEHGEFGRLFSDHPNPIEGALAFSSSWARKLMAIGGHQALANRSFTNVLPSLPPSIETVYVLSRLPAPELKAAIERGDVRPDMRHADARRLLPAEPDDPAEVAELQRDDEIAQVLEPVRAQLVAFAADHPSRMRALKARLRAILRTLERSVELSGTELMVPPERADMGPMNEAEQPEGAK